MEGGGAPRRSLEQGAATSRARTYPLALQGRLAALTGQWRAVALQQERSAHWVVAAPTETTPASALAHPSRAMALLQTTALSVPAAFPGEATVAPRDCGCRTVFAGRRVGRLVLSQQLSGQNGSRVSAWFKFGSNGADSKEAGIYGSQKREDFDKDDVEQYFNYMGMLATEGTYDKMNVLLDQGIPAVDILLLMASSEGDQPKVEELIDAGADGTVKNLEGKNAVDVAANDFIRDLIVKSLKANA